MENWNKLYSGIKKDILKQALEDINDIKNENKHFDKYLKDYTRRSKIIEKINILLASKYSEEINKLKGHQLQPNGSLSEFKTKLYTLFNERNPRYSVNKNDLDFFVDEILAEARSKSIIKYKESTEAHNQRYENDPYFLLEATEKEIMEHLFKAEVMESVFIWNRYNVELGLEDGDRPGAMKDDKDQQPIPEPMKEILMDPEDWHSIWRFMIDQKLVDNKMVGKKIKMTKGANPKINGFIKHLTWHSYFDTKTTTNKDHLSSIKGAWTEILNGDFSISITTMRNKAYPESFYSTYINREDGEALKTKSNETPILVHMKRDFPAKE